MEVRFRIFAQNYKSTFFYIDFRLKLWLLVTQRRLPSIPVFGIKRSTTQEVHEIYSKFT